MTNKENINQNNSAIDNSENILGADHDELVNYHISLKEIDNIERSISLKNKILYTVAATLEILLCVTGESGVNFIGDNQSKKPKKKPEKRRNKRSNT